MGLIKAKNGKFIVKIQCNKKVHVMSLKTDDIQVAESIYREIVKDVVLTKWKSKMVDLPVIDVISCNSSQKRNNKIFSADYKNYIETCKNDNITKTTINIKKKNLELLLKCGIKDYSDFDQDGINRYHNFLNENYQNDSVKKFISETKAFLNDSIRRSDYMRVDYDKIRFPRIKTKVRDIIISSEDLKKIFFVIENEKKDYDFALYLKLLYYTFSRPSEIIDIKINDIDFQNRSIHIYQNKTKKNKKIPISKAAWNELNLEKIILDHESKRLSVQRSFSK